MSLGISESEKQRLFFMASYEREIASLGYQSIAGVDEAGCGPLAGPVVAAAVILPPNTLFVGLNDSKQLTAAARETLYSQIAQSAIWAVSVISSERIDEINILRARLEAMQQAVAALSCRPDYVLIDGNRFPHFTMPAQGIVKGDTLSLSIAAASVIAKVTRDRIMRELDQIWPLYGFSKHKGYGTKQHKHALQIHGPCPAHRKSFHWQKEEKLLDDASS